MNITFDYQEILTRLSAFFPASEVKSFPMTYTRDKKKAMAAFYIDARAVQQRLDDTCVWENVIVEDPRATTGKSIISGIRILIDVDGEKQWITRFDGADNSDIEATKGGLSGAMRRAAVQFGVGRYLYNVEAPWVEMKESPVNKKGNPMYFKTTPRMPAKFLPAGTSAQRAQAVAAEPEKPTSQTKAQAAAASKNAVKLNAAQTKEFAAAKKGKDIKKVTALFKTVTSGKTSIEDGLKAITALPDVS